MTLEHLKCEDGETIAYKRCIGQAEAPTFVWCGGLKSDMEGGKAVHLHAWAKQHDFNFIRFDYFGHGVSSGEFTDGTISRWASDVERVIDGLANGTVVLFGSSMGGWASLLTAAARPDKVKGLVLINPAPDFTEKMVYGSWDKSQRNTLESDGVVYEPSDYDEPYAYSKALIDDGRRRQILDAPITFDGPVHILQGEQDSVVPWEYSFKIIDALQSEDVRYTLVKGGDHSLSRPQDLQLLTQTAKSLITRL